MKSTIVLLSLLTVFTSGCSKTAEDAKSSTPVLTHTYKLQRPFSISFITPNKLKIKRGVDAKRFSVKIYLKKDQLKKLVDVRGDLDQETLELNLPDDLSEYTYIIAVAETRDANGNEMSSVDTYKIGEQEMINEAKELLKNRN
jgi:hypothetical protein